MKTNSTPTESNISGFEPIINRYSRVLILGSMPGTKSLKDAEYYAHPRNAFWEIMQQQFGINKQSPYPERCRALLDRKIAVWDTLKNCERKGSLDSKIKQGSEVSNDFLSLFANYTSITHIFFNGAKAEAVYKKYAKKEIQNSYPELNLKYHRLPSTSPAHASLSIEEKNKLWEIVKTSLQTI